MTHVIVHLMPGIYGPGSKTLGSTPPEVHHPDNGLRISRDTFPIQLPRRVSIQGASALNTLIDLGAAGLTGSGLGVGPAFEFGVNKLWFPPTPGEAPITVPCDGVDSFIDSVAIMGARTDITSATNPGVASAIYIHSDVPSKPTISNCVFFTNLFGIYVASSLDGSVDHHGTLIANNTLAWNRAGIVNGQWPEPTAPGSVSSGRSRLVLVNNVIDTYAEGRASLFARCNVFPSSWSSMAFDGTSAFEGVHPDDLLTQTTNSTTFVNFNAYESIANPTNQDSGNNTGFIFGGMTRPVRPRNTSGAAPWPVSPQAAFNITAITGYPGVWGSTTPPRRGVLFIRDLLCNGQDHSDNAFVNRVSTGPDQFFDGSAMDFRLAPVVTDASSSTPPAEELVRPDLATTKSRRNPLVDAGYTGGTIRQKNGEVRSAPGKLLISPFHEDYPFDNWTWDMEGFGNPRVFDHKKYSDSGFDQQEGENKGVIDIGADELGDLIVAGYRFGTTSFMALTSPRLPASNVTAMHNKYAWYIGPPGVPDNTLTPNYRAYIHLLLTGAPVAGNYQVGGAGSPWYTPNFQLYQLPSKTTFGSCLGYYSPTYVDITPHLLPDIHPWWHRVASFAPSNPIWHPCNQPFPSGTTFPHNLSLYLNPTTNRINPPGTYDGVALGGTSPMTASFLDGAAPFATPAATEADFPRFGLQGGGVWTPATVAVFDAWNRGASGTTGTVLRRTTFPHTEETGAHTPRLLTAVRFSLEHATGGRPTDPSDLTKKLAANAGPFWAGNEANIQSFMIHIEIPPGQ